MDEQAGPLVVSICRRLDGMPLAIELAAARLRSMSLAELHDRLDQRFRLLTGGSRTALERQQTLRATVGWSYSLLTGAERLLLARLSVFAGGFGLDAAEAVGGFGDLDVLDVADLLGSLVDKSLVVAEPAGAILRYRLLETIRLFAAERLAEAGEEEAAVVAAAHCAHFLAVVVPQLAYLLEEDPPVAELHQFRALWQRAAQRAEADDRSSAHLPNQAGALDRYWWARSRLQEAFGLLVPVLRRPGAGADPALFAAALVTATGAAFFIDLAAARQLAEQAVQVARQLGDERLLSTALAALCAGCSFAGEPETGRPFGHESVERARRLGDDVLLAEALRRYLLSINTIDPARALPLYTEAIACTERSGDHFINSRLNNNAGWAALVAGDIPDAARTLALGLMMLAGLHAPWLAIAGHVRNDGAACVERVRPSDETFHRWRGELRAWHGAVRHPQAALHAPRRELADFHLPQPGRRPGPPGRGCGRLGPGSHAARRRASLSGPDRQSVARTLRAGSPGQPGPSARTHGR